MSLELYIRTPDGGVRAVEMRGARMGLGRASSNELCYPEDAGLSRQHLALERMGDEWMLRDLASKNGTLVNGARSTSAVRLRPGDTITAGHLTMRYAAPFRRTDQTVMFMPAREEARTSIALATDLESALSGAGFASGRRMGALIRAGRELSGNQSLEELFQIILDLAIDAVGATRGVVLTLEGGRLETRASKGEGFLISGTVRDRVLNEKASLLVRDARLDEALRLRQSIMAQDIRSMMAAPLATGDRVIGLIYVDSPSQVREFVADDLNLLTVMANIAAIRIEQARLAGVEEAERALARELEQAAVIQRQILPAAPPEVAGVDLAGYNAPCRTVGGDYYDFHAYPDGRVALVVADVAGKGMPAALMVASLQARLEVLFEEDHSPGALVARLNRLCAAKCPAGRFITLFLGVLDPGTGELVYTNAGHNPPLVVRATGEVERLAGGGLILGIWAAAPYEECRSRLDPGDLVTLFSDGVTEAMRPADDEEFGDERLARLLAERRNDPASEIIGAVTEAVSAWTSGAPAADDITLVVVRRAK